MKNPRFLHIISLFLLLTLLVSCGGDTVPVFGSGTDTEATTDTEGLPPETTAQNTTGAPETEPPVPKKRVAITYDDGPSRQGLTRKLVDEFEKYGGKATFFVLGNLISSSTSEEMAYAAEHGFEFGIHAYTHEYYFNNCAEDIFLDELKLTKEAIARYVEAPVTLLRAPGGSITKERALMSGYPIINWSIDTEDWRYKSRTDDATIRQNIDTIVQNALSGVEDGDIILMHEIYTNSYEATCIILRELDTMGFEFVTVSELIGAENLKVGETYFRAP